MIDRALGRAVEEEPASPPPTREPFRSAGALVAHRALGRASIRAPELLRRADAAALASLAEAIAAEVDACLAARSPPTPRRSRK